MPSAKEKSLLSKYLGRKLRRGPYKPKNELDGFLRFTLGGKYKWKRYEFLEDYLRRCQKLNEAEIKETIAGYQKGGLGAMYGLLMEDLKKWRQICLHDRTSRGGKAKANKYPKWSQERRKKFNLKKLESGT